MSLAVLNVFIAYPVLSFGLFKLLMTRDMLNTGKKKYDDKRRMKNNSSKVAKDHDDTAAVEDGDAGDRQKQPLDMEKKMKQKRWWWFITTTMIYLKRRLQYVFKYDMVLAICVVSWLWQSFVWGNIYLGAILASALIVSELVYLQIQDLAARKSTSNFIQKLLRPSIYTFMVAALLTGLSGVGLEAYCISIFFLLWIMQVRRRVC